MIARTLSSRASAIGPAVRLLARDAPLLLHGDDVAAFLEFILRSAE